MENKNGNIKELTVDKQPKDRMYSMCLVFKSDVELLVPGLEAMDIDGLNLIAGNAAEIKLTQVINLIPDADTLARYANIIETGYSEAGKNNGFRLKNTRFERYDYLYMADIPCPVEPKVQKPFAVNIAYDGNFLSVDDGSDDISQEPVAPENARALAMTRFIEVMDDANQATSRTAVNIKWSGIRDDLPTKIRIPDDIPEGELSKWLEGQYNHPVDSYDIERKDG